MAKGGSLNDINKRALRQLLGCMCLTDADLAIHGANAENVLTANAIEYLINGEYKTLAAQAEIDISGLTGLPDDALPDGYTQVFGLQVNAAGTISVVWGQQILNTEIDAGRLVNFPNPDEGNSMFGAVKVKNATGSDFTFGTTALDTANITDTYYDLAFGPADQDF